MNVTPDSSSWQHSEHITAASIYASRSTTSTVLPTTVAAIYESGSRHSTISTTSASIYALRGAASPIDRTPTRVLNLPSSQSSRQLTVQRQLQHRHATLTSARAISRPQTPTLTVRYVVGALPPSTSVSPATICTLGNDLALRGLQSRTPPSAIAALRTTFHREDELKRNWGHHFLSVLPLYAIAHIVTGSPDGEYLLIPRGAQAIADFVLLYLQKWSWTTLRDAYHVFIRFLAWAERHELDTSSCRFTPMDIGLFIRHESDISLARGVGSQGGSSVGSSLGRHLFFVQNNLKVQLGMSTSSGPLLNRSLPTSSTPSPPISIRMVAAFQLLAADPANSDFIRAHAAFWVLLCLGCQRFQQAQRSCIWRRDNEFISLATYLDKHPNPSLQRPRPWWVPVAGIYCTPGSDSSAWSNALDLMLSDLPADAWFLLRATDSTNGDPFNATAWRSTPETYARATTSLRALLCRCSLPVKDSLAFTPHSPRHFLPEVAGSRGIAADERCELGRWAGSTASSYSLLPAEVALAAHLHRASRMPDHYAPTTVELRIRRILLDQTTAVTALLRQRGGPVNLPVVGGFNLLTPVRP